MSASSVTQLSEWAKLQRGAASSGELDPRVVEIASNGLDESLQGVGSDPFGGTSWVGLRVPSLPTDSVGQKASDSRYLFLLATFSLSEGTKATILGWRQMVRLGWIQPRNTDVQTSTARPVTMEVTDPAFKFVDGNVSFHLQALGAPNSQGFVWDLQGPNDLVCFKQNFSTTPALLYKTATTPSKFYTDLTAYNPPNKGRPWGKSLRSGSMSTVYGQRTTWQTHGAWSALGLEVEGPDTIALFASVRQTNTSTRTALTPPSPFYAGGMSAEEQFLLNFPFANYYSVAGSLIVRVGG